MKRLFFLIFSVLIIGLAGCSGNGGGGDDGDGGNEGDDETYTLTMTMEPANGGAVTKSPDLAEYDENEAVTLTALPALGYTFKEWDGADGGDMTNNQITMTGDKNVMAVFEKSSGNNDDYQVNVPAYYLPEKLQFISWDFPNVAHTGIDVDYKMTGYDWHNRTLSWSIDNGPAGMTINPDGTIHWTPVAEGEAAITVGLVFNGTTKITKSFTITVNNSRCLFIATDGNDISGDGSIGNPFESFEKAAELIKNESTGWTIYHRAGTYTKTTFHWIGNTANANLRALSTKNWSLNDQILIRNYPEEAVKYLILDGTGFRMYGNGISFQDMEFEGGDTSETGLHTAAGVSSHKRLVSHGYRALVQNNPSGFHISGSAILDSCFAYDNHDPDDQEHHNNANFNAYCNTNGSGLESFVINCIGGGQSGTNFKIKKNGDNIVHFHNCVAYGDSVGYQGYSNKSSIRHSMLIKEAGSDVKVLGISGGGDYPENNGGGLVSNNLIVQMDQETRAIFQLAYAYDEISETPAWFQDNIIITESSVSSNIYYNNDGANGSNRHQNWSLVFKNNDIFTPSPDNAVNIDGEFPLSILDDYSRGIQNRLLTSRENYSKTIQNRTFTYTNGVFVEF